MNNPFNKLVRKKLRKLEVGKDICLPWAIIEAGGHGGRPPCGAIIAYGNRVYQMSPTDAGLKVLLLEEVRA